jgi:FkbM family methyltransferase
MDYATHPFATAAGQRDVIYRVGTSDINVINQIFSTRDYDFSKLRRGAELRASLSVLGGGRSPLVVDCGANLGASAVFFQSFIPGCRVVAIEPEQSNYDLLRVNTSGLSVECVRAAVASTAGHALVTDPSRRGNKASFRTQVLAVPARTQDVIPCVSINDVFADNARTCFPFIVKIDIEGAEAELFSANTEWVDQTPLIIIELHDWLLTRQGISANFLRCISQHDRDFVHIGENIFSIKNDLMPSPPEVPPFWN